MSTYYFRDLSLLLTFDFLLPTSEFLLQTFWFRLLTSTWPERSQKS